jgi:hypothetical protein
MDENLLIIGQRCSARRFFQGVAPSAVEPKLFQGTFGYLGSYLKLIELVRTERFSETGFIFTKYRERRFQLLLDGLYRYFVRLFRTNFRGLKTLEFYLDKLAPGSLESCEGTLGFFEVPDSPVRRLYWLNRIWKSNLVFHKSFPFEANNADVRAVMGELFIWVHTRCLGNSIDFKGAVNELRAFWDLEATMPVGLHLHTTIRYEPDFDYSIVIPQWLELFIQKQASQFLKNFSRGFFVTLVCVPEEHKELWGGVRMQKVSGDGALIHHYGFIPLVYDRVAHTYLDVHVSDPAVSKALACITNELRSNLSVRIV